MMENELQEETPYNSFVFAFRSPVTREKYLGRLAYFMTYAGITEGNLEDRCNIFGQKCKSDTSWLVNNVIRYLRTHRERVERREITASTLINYIKPIKLFCEQLEIALPWKRITRGIPRGRRYANDRVPTIEEIRRIVEYPDRRIKPIVYTMISSGIRLGAWSYLKWGHVSPIEKDDEIVAARLRVYAEEEDEYVTFITLEAWNELSKWIKYRQDYGEVVTSDSWVMRNLWDVTTPKGAGIVSIPKQLKPEGKRLIIVHLGKAPRPTTKEFKLKTGLVLPKNMNIPSFQDEDELVDLIVNLSWNYRISSMKISRNTIKKELKLVKYLKYCFSLLETSNKLDDSILADMYIPNNCVESKKTTWNLDEDKLSNYDHKPWTIEEFLKNNDRYIVVGASYGIGKTYFSYKLASDLAAKALKNLSTGRIPIHIPLRYQLNKVDNKGNSLESILALLPRQRKVLFVYDGLDEFGEAQKTNTFYKYMQNKLKRYPNSKAVITTRLNSNVPDLFNIESYVRMLPFNSSQIDLFFKKYGIALRSNKISKSGLGLNEIGKPLFCNMISILYNKKKSLVISKKLFLNRTLLFFEIIHGVVLGKPEKEADNYSSTKHQLNEKRVLRKIAELKFIFGDSLTKTIVNNSIKTIQPKIKKQFIEAFEKLISSYFYIQDTKKNEQRIDFIHRSFIDYLLAEYYLECCFRNQLSKINMSRLTLETISFLEGLLYLIKSEKFDKNLYFEKMIETFDIEERNKMDVRNQLINIAIHNFEKNQILIPEDNGEYPQMENTVKHINLQNHRWIAVLLLNKLLDNYEIDKKSFLEFVKSTNNSILGNIVTIENLNLSHSDLTNGLGNYNFSGAKLSHSTFHGVYYGTKFAGADLKFSKFERGTKFIGVDFSGANLSNSHVVLKGEYSPFLLHFINCDFNNSKLINSDLRESSFALSKFHRTDISGANLHYSDISLTEIVDVILDKNTDTGSINLLSKGYEFEWERIRKNKELIRAILDDFDPGNFDRKMKDKILRDNPDYS